jgi:exopolysaccharide biosynthesis polyprenyl glycosylphosphotransferase
MKRFLTPLPVMLLEAALALFAWLAAVQLRVSTGIENAPVPANYWHYGLVLSFLTVTWHSRFGMYRSLRLGGRGGNLGTVVKASLASILTFIFLIYFLAPNRVSRATLAIYAAVSLLVFLIERSALRKILNWSHTNGDSRRIVLVGTGESLREYLKITNENRQIGVTVIGWHDGPAWAEDFAETRAVRKIDLLPSTQKEAEIDAYVVSYTSDSSEKVDEFLKKRYDELTSIYVLPNLKSFALVGLSLEDFSGLPILSLNQPHYSTLDLALKRGIDILGSGLGLIFLSPILLGLGLVVKLTSKGPMIFGQKRMGLDGELFTMWKFRTMKPGPAQPGWTIANDPRRTPFGTFLRRTSLDELPQLWNVFVGEMSLVGPRPEQPFFVEKFRQEIPAYMLRHKVKAGITGWAQVMGWRGDTPLKERIECDLYYIRNWSIALDLKILFLTVKNGIIHDNAY